MKNTDSLKNLKLMRLIIVLLILLNTDFSVLGQSENKNLAIEQVDRIFDAYIKQKENLDSKENQIEMKSALKQLQSNCDIKYFPKLIEVWLYYDPTDFPTRELINPIFEKSKKESLKAIENRIQKKRKWETERDSPLSDLISLRNQLKRN